MRVEASALRRGHGDRHATDDEELTNGGYADRYGTNTAGTPITVSSGFDIAITPTGRTAYVINFQDKLLGGLRVTPIARATNTAGTRIAVGRDPVGIAMTPDQAPTANFSAGAPPRAFHRL